MNMPPAKRFEDLVVWRKAHRFVLGVYRLSNGFPKSETYGLTSQIRRAAVSIPANIAEGFKWRTRPEKIRFMNIAQGSLEADGALKDAATQDRASRPWLCGMWDPFPGPLGPCRVLCSGRLSACRRR